MTALGKPPGPDHSPIPRRHVARGGLALGRAGLERSAPQFPRHVAAGVPMALTLQATTFRKTRRTGKPACLPGWVARAAG